MPRFTFKKEEKLKSKRLIDALFSEGNSITRFPLKLIYLPAKLPEDTLIQAGVSVPKRRFKLAVKRNRIKRLMREAYRLNKHLVFNKMQTSYAFMFLYLANEEPDLHQLNKTMQQLLHQLLKRTHHEKESG